MDISRSYVAWAIVRQNLILDYTCVIVRDSSIAHKDIIHRRRCSNDFIHELDLPQQQVLGIVSWNCPIKRNILSLISYHLSGSSQASEMKTRRQSFSMSSKIYFQVVWDKQSIYLTNI